MKKYYIYSLTNNISQKKYIGYSNDPLKRLRTHKSQVKKGVKTKLYDAIRSYGWVNFSFNVIYESDNQYHTLNIMENYYINLYDTFNNRYNMTLGGEGAIGNIPWCKGKHPKQLLWDDKRKKDHSLYLKNLWDDNKKTELSDKWTDEMKSVQRDKSKIAWKDKINNGYEVLVNTKMLTCPYCGMINNIGNSKRWHFNNCKLHKELI